MKEEPTGLRMRFTARWNPTSLAAACLKHLAGDCYRTQRFASGFEPPVLPFSRQSLYVICRIINTNASPFFEVANVLSVFDIPYPA